MKKIFKQVFFCVVAMMSIMSTTQVANANSSNYDDEYLTTKDCFDLGFQYLQAEEYDLAIPLLSISAEDGDIAAQYLLGAHYAYCNDISERDYELAFYWMYCSADQGNPYAFSTLGDFFFNGEVVDYDAETAFNSYEIAANYGVNHAQYMLGIMYSKGIGTEKDHDKALEWLAIANNNGHPDALDAILSLMD